MRLPPSDKSGKPKLKPKYAMNLTTARRLTVCAMNLTTARWLTVRLTAETMVPRVGIAHGKTHPSMQVKRAVTTKLTAMPLPL